MKVPDQIRIRAMNNPYSQAVDDKFVQIAILIVVTPLAIGALNPALSKGIRQRNFLLRLRAIEE